MKLAVPLKCKPILRQNRDLKLLRNYYIFYGFALNKRNFMIIIIITLCRLFWSNRPRSPEQFPISTPSFTSPFISSLQVALDKVQEFSSWYAPATLTNHCRTYPSQTWFSSTFVQSLYLHSLFCAQIFCYIFRFRWKHCQEFVFWHTVIHIFKVDISLLHSWERCISATNKWIISNEEEEEIVTLSLPRIYVTSVNLA